MVAIFPKLCLWRRSLRLNLGGIDPEKLYRATLTASISCDVFVVAQGLINHCPGQHVSLDYLNGKIEVSWWMPYKQKITQTCSACRLGFNMQH